MAQREDLERHDLPDDEIEESRDFAIERDRNREPGRMEAVDERDRPDDSIKRGDSSS